MLGCINNTKKYSAERINSNLLQFWCLSLVLILTIILGDCNFKTMAASSDTSENEISYASMNYYNEPYKPDTPCTFPSPYPNRKDFAAKCNLPIEHNIRYNICDASGNAISFTEGSRINL